MAASWNPDLVILDLMLPGIDGYQVLQSHPRPRSHVPVIILSARGEEADKVRGFRLDADQYVTKPFGVLELLERVGAAASPLGARAGNGAARKPKSRFGDVVVDTAVAHGLRATASRARSRPKAYELLLALCARRRGGDARGSAHRGVGLRRVRDVPHGRLARRRAAAQARGDPAEPRHIVTVWKIGYRFARLTHFSHNFHTVPPPSHRWALVVYYARTTRRGAPLHP